MVGSHCCIWTEERQNQTIFCGDPEEAFDHTSEDVPPGTQVSEWGVEGLSPKGVVTAGGVTQSPACIPEAVCHVESSSVALLPEPLDQWLC